jgi:RimJ/RimL family protein N-acetyltransferase
MASALAGMIEVMPAELSFAEKPTITGERVVLRPVESADAAGLAAVDDEALRLTGTQRKAGMKKLRRWYATRAVHADRLDLSIIDRASGQWAGEVVLNNLDTANRSCGFRILLRSAEFRDRGLGTEASRLALAHAFEVVGVHRVELQVYAFNPRAKHVYDKLGFRYEGTRRQALRWDGQWIDSHVLAILASEWRAGRATREGSSRNRRGS